MYNEDVKKSSAAAPLISQTSMYMTSLSPYSYARLYSNAYHDPLEVACFYCERFIRKLGCKIDDS